MQARAKRSRESIPLLSKDRISVFSPHCCWAVVASCSSLLLLAFTIHHRSTNRSIPQVQDFVGARLVASCSFHTGYHDGVRVEVYNDNQRVLKFADDAGWTESLVQCKGPPPLFEKLAEFGKDSNPSKRYDCADKGVREVLRCREPRSLQSGISSDAALSTLLKDCEINPPKVLILGLGGGYYHTAISQTCPKASILSLEPSKTVVKAARDFFGFAGKVLTLDADMGLRRLAKHKQQIDVLVSDMGQHAFSPQEMEAAIKVLKPGGTVIDHECYIQEKEQLSLLRHIFVDVKAEADPRLNHCTYYTAKKAIGIASHESLEKGWNVAELGSL